jgi:hypothetical protein
MKLLLSFCLLPFTAIAQSPMFGLFGVNCLQTVGDQGNLRRINKPACIIYNREYCWYYAPNCDVVSFRIRAYTKDLNSATKSIHESFVNQESQTTADGFYHIIVDQTNGGTSFQISTPTGTVVVQNAQRFSENGHVKTGAMKIDWAAVRAGEAHADSVKAGLIRRPDEAYRDSLMSALSRHALFVDKRWSTKDLSERAAAWNRDSVWRTRHPGQ